MNGWSSPALPSDHWAPAQLVLARRRLTLVGPLSVARDADGAVVLHPGRIWSVAPVPPAPGVFALVEGGTVRYVGHSLDLGRTFSRHGLGEVSRRAGTDPADAEHRRLHHLLVAAAVENRTVDLYVLLSGPAAPRGIGWLLRGLLRGRASVGPEAAEENQGPDVGDPASPAARRSAEIAEQVRAATRGAWQLP